MKIEKKNDIIIQTLPEEYNMITLSQMMELSNDKKLFEDIKYLVINGEEFITIDCIGEEYLIIKMNHNLKEVYFYNLPQFAINIFNILAEPDNGRQIKHFNSFDEIISEINKL